MTTRVLDAASNETPSASVADEVATFDNLAAVSKSVLTPRQQAPAGRSVPRWTALRCPGAPATMPGKPMHHSLSAAAIFVTLSSALEGRTSDLAPATFANARVAS